MTADINDSQRMIGPENRTTGHTAQHPVNRRDWLRLSPPVMSEQCFGAFATAGPKYASALGFVAHILIETDYERALNVKRGEQLFVDDQSAGPVNTRYARFILERNPGLDAKAKEVIRKGGYRRPDLLLHDIQLQEFEEIKPDSQTGREGGQRQIIEIWNWMRSVGLKNYNFGTNYSPQGRVLQIFEFKLAGVPVEVYLKPRRFVPGLIVYNYCLRTDWNRLKKTAVVAAFLALLIFVLGRVGVPGPLPNPMPVPTPVLPVPAPTLPIVPIPDPIREPAIPPVRNPVTNRERSLPDRRDFSTQERGLLPQPDYTSVTLSDDLRFALASLKENQIRSPRLIVS